MAFIFKSYDESKLQTNIMAISFVFSFRVENRVSRDITSHVSSELIVFRFRENGSSFRAISKSNFLIFCPPPPICAWLSHGLFTTCSRVFHEQFMTCYWLINCSQLVDKLYILLFKSLPRPIHNFFMNCSLYDLSFTRSQLFHNKLFMTFSSLVHNLFGTCP